MKKIIGFYNYTVILTYLSLISAIYAMIFSIGEHYWPAIACVGLSGLFDMFDGKVARSKKNRTDSEKMFGIQLDSLCDLVAFGAAPVVLCYNMGMDDFIEMAVLLFYCICGVIRIAYFNTLEIEDFYANTSAEKVYHGLPITSIAIILPIVFLTNFFVASAIVYKAILTAIMFITGVLFIMDFTFKKPNNRFLICTVSIVTIVIILALYLGPTYIRPGEWDLTRFNW